MQPSVCPCRMQSGCRDSNPSRYCPWHAFGQCAHCWQGWNCGHCAWGCRCRGSQLFRCVVLISDRHPSFPVFFVRSLVRSNHRSDTVLLSNGSRISRPCLEIFSRNREVVLSEKDLCVCYTAKKVTYRSFPQWEIMAFVAFCLEEFAFALQEKYNRISRKARGPCTSTFVDLIRLFLSKISKMPYRRI